VKILLIALLFFTLSDARENPFFPSDGEKDIPYTSNEDTTIPPLKKASITLPKQARVLQSVTVQYKNLDGSQETKNIQLENAIDWHQPIFISQNNTSDEIQKNEALKENTLKNDVKKAETIKKEVVEEKIDTKDKEKNYKKIASMEYASFYTSNKYVKIVTNDKAIRNFLLVKPHRIVIDFEKNSSLDTQEQNITEDIVTKVRIGNHDGYYRVVIELDGSYKYTIKNIENGYILQLL
jgi:hypothetical protein